MLPTIKLIENKVLKLSEIKLAKSIIDENKIIIVKSWGHFMEQWTNLKIEKVWFDNENIIIQTDDGTQKSHPLRWFPQLFNATDKQRQKFEIGKWGDDIHWEELNEDLSLEGFFTYNKDVIEQQRNEVSRVFNQFPVLNISKFAERTKINCSLLASYICNEKKPGERKKKQIESALHQHGNDLLSVKL